MREGVHINEMSKLYVKDKRLGTAVLDHDFFFFESLRAIKLIQTTLSLKKLSKCGTFKVIKNVFCHIYLNHHT